MTSTFRTFLSDASAKHLHGLISDVCVVAVLFSLFAATAAVPREGRAQMLDLPGVFCVADVMIPFGSWDRYDEGGNITLETSEEKAKGETRIRLKFTYSVGEEKREFARYLKPGTQKGALYTPEGVERGSFEYIQLKKGKEKYLKIEVSTLNTTTNKIETREYEFKYVEPKSDILFEHELTDESFVGFEIPDDDSAALDRGLSDVMTIEDDPADLPEAAQPEALRCSISASDLMAVEIGMDPIVQGTGQLFQDADMQDAESCR